MSNYTKRRARNLQAITGMPYQAAHRAVVDGAEYEASVRSGYEFSDFITPRERRTWLQVNTGDLDCTNGRHRMDTEELGQCIGCGVYMATVYDNEGNDHTAVIDEDTFFKQCIQVEMYYNWAPPMAMLDGNTQAEYFWTNWRAQHPEFTQTTPQASWPETSFA